MFVCKSPFKPQQLSLADGFIVALMILGYFRWCYLQLIAVFVLYLNTLYKLDFFPFISLITHCCLTKIRL